MIKNIIFTVLTIFVISSCKEEKALTCSQILRITQTDCYQKFSDYDIVRRGEGLYIITPAHDSIRYMYKNENEIIKYYKQVDSSIFNTISISNDEFIEIQSVAKCFYTLQIREVNGYNFTNQSIIELIIDDYNVAYCIKNFDYLSSNQINWLNNETLKCKENLYLKSFKTKDHIKEGLWYEK